MSGNSVLSDHDVNAPVSSAKTRDNKSASTTLDYHRQLLQSKINEQNRSSHQYVSPSDGIMSPCTAKLSAYRSKHLMKAKPQSLFGKASSNTNSKPFQPFASSSQTTTAVKESDAESRSDDSRVASKESSPGQ